MVAANAGLSAVISFIGLGREDAAKFAEDNELKNVTVAVCDLKNAARFRISPAASVTVMHYVDKKVVANFAVAPKGLDDAKVVAIIGATAEMLPKKKSEQ